MVKPKIYGDSMYMPCPGCNTMILFTKNSSNYLINDGRRRRVTIPELWTPLDHCPNALCNWSNIDMEY